MASEILVVPEEHLSDVIEVIRVGLANLIVHRDIERALTKWCNDEERYLNQLEDGE